MLLCFIVWVALVQLQLYRT